MNKLTILVGSFAMMMASCASKKEEKKEITAYSVTSPLIKDTTFIKEYVAQIQSIQNVEIKAQEKGYLEAFRIDEGQHVSSGQVLFNIMPKLYEADVLKAKAASKSEELELKNVKTLSDKNIVSKTELAIAQAKLEGAQAEQKLAEAHLAFTSIRAPFEGTIDRIRFKKGSLIEEGDILTTLSNNREVYAYFNVSEDEYLNYKNRPKDDIINRVSLLLPNNDVHKYKGVIQTVESEFDNTTGTIAFRAKFPNPEFLLKHGETGKVRMTIPIHNAMIIPQKATYEIQDKIYVYVVDKNNKISSRNIVVKQKMENVYLIESGLSANDQILLEGIQSVKDDDIIKPKFIPATQVLSELQLIKQ